ncbi:3',5'-cyclic-AMP phosphodiesterase [Gilvimarinus sp. DA14]|uniref:3',5'-cyclic-AMP phosphodiesterase n=1 Tax=Gilvimarinus sp. DA14 TaxID=2956798 RepID=UPI002112BBCF|nr:3',5'-cyclic-AMP phosphodiesterase [Gilvimarinus sp. DA14]
MAASAISTQSTGTPVRLIQITDTHLGAADGDTLLGLNTDQSLADVLALIAREQPDPAAVVCTGDVASEPDADCYSRFLDTLQRNFDCPLGWLPGNHDLADVMYQVAHVTQPAHRTMLVGGWLLVLLDSSVPGYVHGELAAAEMAFLRDTLAAHPDTPTLIMLHHQPVAVGSEWIDQYIVRNHAEFFAALESQSQVKAVCWGHVHQTFERLLDERLLLATPSTCVQFKPGCDDFTVDTQMPGYRWFDLYPDGRLETGVSRVTDKSYVIDYKSAGY